MAVEDGSWRKKGQHEQSTRLLYDEINLINFFSSRKRVHVTRLCVRSSVVATIKPEVREADGR